MGLYITLKPGPFRIGDLWAKKDEFQSTGEEGMLEVFIEDFYAVVDDIVAPPEKGETSTGLSIENIRNLIQSVDWIDEPD